MAGTYLTISEGMFRTLFWSLFHFSFCSVFFLKGWLLFRNFLITEGTSHIGNLQPTTPRVVPANYLGPSSIVSYPAEGAWEKVR